MSSRRRSKIKPSPRSEVFERILVKDFLKDFICCLPELQIISCVSNFFKKISPKDFLRSNPQKIHGTHGEHGKDYS